MTYSLRPYLLATGIDIENKKITLTADNLVCQNNSGEKTMWLDSEGNLTTRGVYNNLLSVISSANDSRYITWEDESDWTTHGCLDVLRCGNVLKITKLPAMGSWDGSATSKLLRLPWFVSYEDKDRTKTNNPYPNASSPHKIKADEMRQLVGKKIDIIFDIPSGDSIGQWKLSGAFNIKPTALDSAVANTVRSLANGQTTVDYEGDIMNNRMDISIIHKMTVHLECKLVWVINGAGQDANKRNYFAYIWTAYSSYGTTDDRPETIEEEWT